jgi:hypothetical protein
VIAMSGRFSLIDVAMLICYIPLTVYIRLLHVRKQTPPYRHPTHVDGRRPVVAESCLSDARRTYTPQRHCTAEWQLMAPEFAAACRYVSQPF